MAAEVIIFEPRELARSRYHVRDALKGQLTRIKAREAEIEARKQLDNDIAELRQKIIEAGEIPCA